MVLVRGDRDNRPARRAGRKWEGTSSRPAYVPTGRTYHAAPLKGEELVRRRSNLLVLLGLASFVLGLVAVYLITGDDDDGGGGGGGGDTIEVVVATEDLAAGALGQDAIDSGSVELQRVDRADLQPDAVTTLSELSASALVTAVFDGEQIRRSSLRSISIARAEIPEGFEAVAVEIDFVAGGADQIQRGDRVNIFLVIPGPLQVSGIGEDGTALAVPPPYNTPRAELLLTNVEVLNRTEPTAALQTQTTTPTGTATTTTGSSVVYELALRTVDVEKVIYATTAAGNEIYLSRVRLDEEGNPSPPAGPTTGVDFVNILAVEADQAFREANG